MQDVHFTPPQLAKLFKVNVSTIKRWADKGFLKVIRTPGGHRRIAKKQLEEFIAKNPQYSSNSYIIKRLQKKEVCPEPNCWKKYYRYLKDNDNAKALHLIDRLFLSGTKVLKILQEVITPTLRQMSQDWRAGQITVFEEHRMNFAIRSHLLHINELLPDTVTDKSPKAIVACAPGEYHELPLQLLSIIFKKHAWQTYILGINIEIKELIKAAKKIKPQIIIITKTQVDKKMPPYLDTITAFAKKNNICLAFGGAAWRSILKKNKWTAKKCAQYFPALKMFDDYLENYRRK